MLKIDVITIFPSIFEGPLTESIIKRAQDKKLVTINLHDLREYTDDAHNTVDDKPYGGGSGMVMKAEPIFRAVDSFKSKESKLILMSPQGKKFSQDLAVELSKQDHLLFICGHYEGIDERIRTGLEPMEISIGDYVLTNGSLSAIVVIDAVVRLVKGVLGNPDSVTEESFNNGLLEYPQYTRPSDYRGMKVPEELISGNHAEIERWRKEQAVKRTKKRRPDLYQKNNDL